MKNQALVTTLAVLLAVSLSAVVALVVSSEVTGSSQTVIAVDPVELNDSGIPEDAKTLLEVATDTRIDEAVEATTAGLTTEAEAAQAADTTDDDAATDDAPADEVDEADDAPADTDPVDNGPTDSGDAPETGPAAPADPAPADPVPGDGPSVPSDSGDAPESGPAAPADPGDADASPEGPGPADSGDAPETGPATPDDDDEPAPADDDDEPAPVEPLPGDDGVSILCAPGYTKIDGLCEFTGCPFLTYLVADTCVPLGETSPCPEGQHALPGGFCLPDLVVVIPDADPTCLAGFHVVDGECVTVCPDGHSFVGGFCLPDFDIPDFEVNPDLLPDLDLDLSLFVPQVDPGLLGN